MKSRILLCFTFFHSKSEACVDVLSPVDFTVGPFLDEMCEDKLPPLLVLGVNRLNFLSGEEAKQISFVELHFEQRKKDVN